MKTEIASLKRIEFAYFGIFLAVLVAVFALNYVAGGTLTSPAHLAIDLASPPDTPQAWLIQEWAVVKYRALFRLIVRGSWALLFAPNDAQNFYRVFVFWSFVFFYCAVVTLYFFLRALEFERRVSFIGCLLFLLSPPVLLAYKYPVYTREDVLAYWLVLLGLIAACQARLFWVSLISALAALTRETAMILPLAYFVGAAGAWRKKVLVWILPVAALFGIRWLWGLVIGNNFASSILNFQTPFETLAFLYCVFGALWLPYVLGLRDRWRRGEFPNHGWRVMTISGPLILVLVLGSAIFLARAREARIAFIQFPWAIVFALDWFRNQRAWLAARASSFSFWVLACAIWGILSALVLYFHLTNPEGMRAYLADFKNGYWLVAGTLHLSITLAIFLPWLRRRPSQLVQKTQAS